MIFLGPVTASANSLPQYAADKHIGVTSCAGSTCHGSAAPWKNSNVKQNEYIIWAQKDKHAKAYSVLHNERSARIARNLGLKNAYDAPVCLNCHADNVSAGNRGKVFQISDGVGCEACHGGAERWLGVHISGSGGHAENVKAGMYPTDDPVARAKLCMSCHFGDSNKFVTHRIMGAGHPRMPFELDTFTAIQPAHFHVTENYRKRKKVASDVQVWAVGQAVAINTVLDGLLDPKRNHDGIFPELVFFDCFACHHPMSNIRWQPRSGTGLGPGVVRLNDANLVMLRVLTSTIDPAMSKKLTAQTLALHKASTEGQPQTVEAAKALRATTGALQDRLAHQTFDTKQMQVLLLALVREGKTGEYTDYAAAEQATMAVASVVAAMKQSGMVDEARYKAMQGGLDKVYDAVAKDESYKPTTFVQALDEFEATIPKS